jgi:hypothetical protein
MKKLIALLIAVGVAGAAVAADYTPSSEEDTSAAITRGAATFTTVAAGDVAITGSIEPDIVVVTDAAAYTVLDNNSGQVHIVPDLTADCTITMPAEAANQYYKFVYAGGAADGQDWIIDTGTNTAYFVGGLTQIDVTGVGTNVVTQYYSDGNSNSKLGVLTPEAGTVVELWCEDGVTWYVSGTVYSDTDTGVTFADQ